MKVFPVLNIPLYGEKPVVPITANETQRCIGWSINAMFSLAVLDTPGFSLRRAERQPLYHFFNRWRVVIR